MEEYDWLSTVVEVVGLKAVIRRDVAQLSQ